MVDAFVFYRWHACNCICTHWEKKIYFNVKRPRAQLMAIYGEDHPIWLKWRVRSYYSVPFVLSGQYPSWQVLNKKHDEWSLGMVGNGIPILLCFVPFHLVTPRSYMSIANGIWSIRGKSIKQKDVATFVPSHLLPRRRVYMDVGNEKRIERGIWGCKEK